jgi:hypothetical protein
VINSVEKIMLSVSREGRILDRFCLRGLRIEEITQFVEELGVEGIDKLGVDVEIILLETPLPTYIPRRYL